MSSFTPIRGFERSVAWRATFLQDLANFPQSDAFVESFQRSSSSGMPPIALVFADAAQAEEACAYFDIQWNFPYSVSEPQPVRRDGLKQDLTGLVLFPVLANRKNGAQVKPNAPDNEACAEWAERLDATRLGGLDHALPELASKEAAHLKSVEMEAFNRSVIVRLTSTDQIPQLAQLGENKARDERIKTAIENGGRAYALVMPNPLAAHRAEQYFKRAQLPYDIEQINGRSPEGKLSTLIITSDPVNIGRQTPDVAAQWADIHKEMDRRLGNIALPVESLENAYAQHHKWRLGYAEAIRPQYSAGWAQTRGAFLDSLKQGVHYLAERESLLPDDFPANAKIAARESIEAQQPVHVLAFTDIALARRAQVLLNDMDAPFTIHLSPGKTLKAGEASISNLAGGGILMREPGKEGQPPGAVINVKPCVLMLVPKKKIDLQNRTHALALDLLRHEMPQADSMGQAYAVLEKQAMEASWTASAANR